VTRRIAPWWALTGGALLLAGAAIVFARALGTRTNYDEGVYLASLDALRRGAALGSDVYTSQPPVFYWVLRVLAAPFGTSIEGIRVGFVLLALAGIAAAAVLGWCRYGPTAGLAAGAFLAIGAPYPTVAPTVAAAVPAVALGLIALALLAPALSVNGSRWWSAAAGAAYTAAVLTKLLAAPFAVPLVALALAARAGRRLLPVALVGAAGFAAVVAIAHVGALPDIWSAVIGDHTGAKELGSYGDNARWIRDHLEPRTPISWLVAAGFVAFLVSRRARSVWPLWTLVPAAALFLFLVRPLADHHLVLLSAAYAISAGPSLALGIGDLRPTLRAVAAGVLCLAVAAGLYQEQRRLHRNDVAEPAEVTWAVAAVDAATASSAVVVTDQPIVVFRANRETPGPLVDTSNTRISGGGLTADEIVAQIDDARPAAVVVDRMFRTLPLVLAALRERFPVRVTCGEATLYLSRPSPTPLPTCPA
jgi:4-amino-4-deoxy-L-arabinose transferase-like glycosyltransferase